MKKLFSNSLISKKLIKHPLTLEYNKTRNKEISKQRIIFKMLYKRLKIFKILNDRYRCRRRMKNKSL